MAGNPDSKKKRIQTYAEFWPYYLGEHSSAKSRALHFIGSTLAILFLLTGVALMDMRYVGAAVFMGYFFAWIGHFFIEKNRPATFTYPFWSLISDFKMWGLTIVGKMDSELKKAAALRSAFEKK